MGEAFLGKGWAFPVSLAADSEILPASEEEKIAQSIRIILGTAPGERLMRPDFGCGIHNYVFAPNNVRTTGLIRFSVEDSLNRWEPRIDLESVDVQADPNDAATILISITYRVKSTDSRYNMVYPFYLERGGS